MEQEQQRNNQNPGELSYALQYILVCLLSLWQPMRPKIIFLSNLICYLFLGQNLDTNLVVVNNYNSI